MKEIKIRPLSVFKKKHPKEYKDIEKNSRSIFPTSSAKQAENNFYWFFSFTFASEYIDSYDNGLMLQGKGEFYHFFWRNGETRANVKTITELGRLLMTGWYYEELDFTLDISRALYNAWMYKKEHEIDFNDSEFENAIKEIRSNILFYLSNKDELKVYLLKHFFAEQIKPLLPEEPKEQKEFNEIIEFLKNEKLHNLKKNPDYYYHRTLMLESYVEYLQEQLEEYGIPYIEESQFEKDKEAENNTFIESWVSKITSENSLYESQERKVLLGVTLHIGDEHHEH